MVKTAMTSIVTMDAGDSDCNAAFVSPHNVGSNASEGK